MVYSLSDDYNHYNIRTSTSCAEFKLNAVVYSLNVSNLFHLKNSSRM